MQTVTKAKLYPTRIYLAQNIRAQIVELLNTSLAATTDLKTQVKQAHWNVKGMDFYQLHQLFDEIASDLEELSAVYRSGSRTSHSFGWCCLWDS